MKNTLTALLLLALFSCKKSEPVQTPPPPPPVNEPPLLRRTVGRFAGGNDSTVVTYTHDAARKVVLLHHRDSAQTFTHRIVRGNNGIIRQTIYRTSASADSIITDVNYDLTAGRYTHRVRRQAGVLIDSVVLTHHASGKVASEITHTFSTSTGSYRPLFRREFTYTGDNMTEMRVYNYVTATSSFSLLQTLQFQYDQNVSPRKNDDLQLAGIGSYEAASANNIQGFANIFANNPGQPQVYMYNYTYNNSQLPTSYTRTTNVASIPVLIQTLYYQ